MSFFTIKEIEMHKKVMGKYQVYLLVKKLDRGKSSRKGYCGEIECWF